MLENIRGIITLPRTFSPHDNTQDIRSCPPTSSPVSQDEAHAFVNLRCRPHCFRGPLNCVQHQRGVHQLQRLGVEGILFRKLPFVSVPHLECAHGASCGYDIISASSFEASTDPGKEGNRNVGAQEHAVLYVQGVHHLGRREARTLGPGEHVLEGYLFACGRWDFSVHRTVPSPSWFRFVLRCGESFRSGSRSRCTRFLTEKPT